MNTKPARKNEYKRNTKERINHRGSKTNSRQVIDKYRNIYTHPSDRCQRQEINTKNKRNERRRVNKHQQKPNEKQRHETRQNKGGRGEGKTNMANMATNLNEQ